VNDISRLQNRREPLRTGLPPRGTVIKILVADDHAIFREGLKRILGDTKDMVVAGEAATHREVIAKLWKSDYDLVLLDISFPGRSGLDVLKQLRAIKPQLPVLILSMHPEEQYAVRALRAGASGYLTKAAAADELIKAIRKIARGRKYITSTLAEKLAFEIENHSDKPLHKTLSDREYQVMCMIASGKRIKDIASELSLSVKTIDTYRSRTLKKMNLQNTAQLTHYAIKNGLVD